jgi:hypothetical protein
MKLWERKTRVQPKLPKTIAPGDILEFKIDARQWDYFKAHGDRLPDAMDIGNEFQLARVKMNGLLNRPYISIEVLTVQAIDSQPSKEPKQ